MEPEQLLVHKDQSSQQRASDYRDLLSKHEISCSLSARGCCWDNAVVERLFSTLQPKASAQQQLELDLDDNRETLISPQQLQRDRAFRIEGDYNRERRRSKIGYISPIDYEQQFIAAPTRTL